jgi:hypothetical protein
MRAICLLPGNKVKQSFNFDQKSKIQGEFFHMKGGGKSQLCKWFTLRDIEIRISKYSTFKVLNRLVLVFNLALKFTSFLELDDFWQGWVLYAESLMLMRY